MRYLFSLPSVRFELKTEAGAGPITFDVLGPEGTADMLRKL